jgi:hypothetical protein
MPTLLAAASPAYLAQGHVINTLTQLQFYTTSHNIVQHAYSGPMPGLCPGALESGEILDLSQDTSKSGAAKVGSSPWQLREHLG